MDYQRDQRLRVAAARADFLEYGQSGAAGVADVVSASWQRSQSAGVDADRFHVKFHEDMDTDTRLVRCARPVLERLSDDMAEVPVSIALCDSRARIIDRRDCSSAVARLLDRVDFSPGFSFEERGVGTNGVGTVFESGSSISVVGAEHFNHALVQFACTGAPIMDPISGRIEGVLDVSLLAESWTPLIEALVKSAAADISRNLLFDRSHKQRALFEMYLKADSRPRQAVIAVGSSVMVNSRAQSLFTPDEQLAIHHHALHLTSLSERVSEPMVLDTGRTIHLRAIRVLCGEEIAGILVVPSELGTDEQIDKPDRGPIPADGAPHRLTVSVSDRNRDSSSCTDPGSRCPAWQSAITRTSSAVESREALLIVGEEGSGRSTIGVQQFTRVHPHAKLVPVSVGQTPLAQQIRHVDKTAVSLVIMRHLDRATDADAEAACAFLRSLSTRDNVYAIATVESSALENTSSTLGTLLEFFCTSVPVPPLRFRTVDLDLIIASILREIAPRRKTRLSPESYRTLSAYSWPGNVTELKRALSIAIQHRPVGEIQVEDLPTFCRTSSSSRTLSRLEEAEREAILTALREAGGNRVRAAVDLGMSRSSLYRKLKNYGLESL